METRREIRHHSMVSSNTRTRTQERTHFCYGKYFRLLFVSPPYRSEKMFSFISFLFAYLRISKRWGQEDVVEGHSFHPLPHHSPVFLILFIFIRKPFGWFLLYFISFKYRKRDSQILMVGQARNYYLNCIFGYSLPYL